MARAHQHETTVVDQPERHDDHVVDRVRTSDASGLNLFSRVLALVAAAVPTIIGLVALLRFDWDNGMDAAPVRVAGMTFSPWIAVGMLVCGVLALIAAALPDRETKLLLGALLVCGGIAIMATTPVVQQVELTDRMAWLAVIVGAVMLVAGLLASQRSTVRREVRSSADLGR